MNAEEVMRKTLELAQKQLDNYLQEVKKEENDQKGRPYNWLNIKAKNKTCKHIWEYNGHGHNYSCYKCKLCGEEGDY